MKTIIKNYIKHLYDTMAENSESELIKFFKKNTKARYLDCGCFNGRRTIKMARLISTNEIFGVDSNEKKINEAVNLKIKAIKGDLNKVLPFKNNYFDVVTSIHSIEHLVYPDIFVKEVHRLLKPGGKFIILTPNLASWHNIFALIIGIQPFSGPNIFSDSYSSASFKMIDSLREKELINRKKLQINQEDGRHIKVMTYKTLLKLLQMNNFHISKRAGFGYYPLPNFISKIFSKIDISHTHYVIIEAVK